MLFENIFEVFGKSKARYVVVGGVAVVLHGYARLTADVDLAVDWNSPGAAKLIEAMAALGLKPRAPVDPAGLADAKTRESWREDPRILPTSRPWKC